MHPVLPASLTIDGGPSPPAAAATFAIAIVAFALVFLAGFFFWSRE